MDSEIKPSTRLMREGAAGVEGEAQVIAQAQHLETRTLADTERELILAALKTHNQKDAARALGISYRKIQMRVKSYRQAGYVIGQAPPRPRRIVPTFQPHSEIWDLRSNTGLVCQIDTVHHKGTVRPVETFIYERVCPGCMTNFRTSMAIKKHCCEECAAAARHRGDRSSNRLALKGTPTDPDEVAAYLATVRKSVFEGEWVALIAEQFGTDERYRPLIESLLTVKARYTKAEKV